MLPFLGVALLAGLAACAVADPESRRLSPATPTELDRPCPFLDPTGAPTGITGHGIACPPARRTP
jgi:hypothetical protein